MNEDLSNLLSVTDAGAEPQEDSPAEGDVFVFPASFAQRRLWLMDQLEPGTPAYNIPIAVRLVGALNVDALRAAIDTIVTRHEALRTVFAMMDGELVQAIRSDVTIPLPLVDLSPLPECERQVQVHVLARDEARRSFDLAEGGVLRASLLRMREGEHVLLLTMHHIASDGWSMGVLIREVAALYAAFVMDMPSPLPELPIQYADFTLWQRERLQGDLLEAQLAYWQRQLDGLDALELPTDRPRPSVQTFQGALHVIALPAPLTAQLDALGKSEGATLFMTLLAGVFVLLARHSGQVALAVGSPIANRTQAELESLIGFFVNTLVLRVDLSDGPSFRTLLRRVREVTLDAYAHQDVPFERLVEALQPSRDMSRAPMFQVMFALQNAPMPALALPGLALSVIDIEAGVAKFDLTINLEERPEGIGGWIEFNTDLFERATIVRLSEGLRTLLEGAVAAPDQRVALLPLLSEAEHASVLARVREEGRQAIPEGQVHTLFEAWAAHAPGALAVCGPSLAAPSGGMGTLSYGELNRRADRLAQKLRAMGVGAGVIVGVYVERSIELIVALLAVLKSGGAYLPIDPAYPEERVRFMATDAHVAVLLTQKRLCLDVLPPELRVMLLDGAESDAGEAGTPRCDVTGGNRARAEEAGRDVAYVIYTSGSTGRPKGTAVEHRSLMNLVAWHQRAYAVTARDRATQLAGPAFDASVWELWPHLTCGASVHLPAEALRSSPRDLLQWMADQAITVCFLPTPLAEALLGEELPDGLGLRLLLTGGDTLHRGVPAGLPFRVVNHYGPTEATVVTTCAAVAEDAPGRFPPPIGRAISNAQVYVLDAEQRLVPSGVPGEVYIGGAGLARGYLGRPGLTAERFVPDPFGGEAGGRLYRTGDLARALPDGNLLFLGRVDHQVKLRGFRIELGEVEAALQRHPAVREAVVVVREDDARQRRLVAYLVEGVDARPSEEELRRYVGNTLPEYMVPQAVVWLEALPLTPNGKLDRKALPAPEASGLSGEGEHVAPRTDTERALAGVWSTVLGVEGIGVHDDFFALGGHSLLATQVVTRLREVFGMDLPLRALFEARTVGSLAVQIEARRSEAGGARPGRIERADRTKPLPLSFAQQRLWFLAQLDPESAGYHVPAGVQLRGALKGHALAQALDEVVSRHEALRTTFSVEEGRPVQRIQAPEPVRLHEHDVTEQPPEARDAAVKALLHALSQQPFDLGTGPLLRADLVKVDAEEHVLLLTLHHIISDGWSTGVLIGELAALYEAAVEGKRSPLPPLSIQYADFAQWQRGWLEGAVLSEQLAYWREQLGDGVAQLNLPTDRARPAVQSFRGAVHTQLLPRGLLEQVQALSQQAGTTLYMTLLATFQLLLGRYASQDDIAVGSPIANRTRPELEGLIGVFINTLVLRTRLSGNPTFRELLGRVREVTLGAYAHQDVPFERLVEELQTERELSRSPLFQVFFIVQNAPMPSLELAGLQMKALDLDTGTSKFDLTFSLVEQPEGLRLWIEYTTDLFEAATVERMGRHFEQLLGAACGQPDMSIWRLPMLGEGELRELVVERNATGRDYPLETTLPEMLKAQALRTPEARAVVFGEDALSYGELDARAEALARRLRRCGVGGEARVGVCLRRSAELVVVLVAILKAGGAYVPLDPAYPVERLGFMLEDAQAALLITQSSLRSLLPEVSMPVLELDTAAAEETAAGPLEPRSGAMLPGQLAYLIYTSGSTGRPKAVAITHRNAVAMIHWALEAFEREDLARVVAATSICFDLSVFELFVPLCCGGQVTLLDSILDLPSLPKDSGVTLVNTVPSAMNELVRSGGLPSSVRVVNLAGEALPSSLVEGLYRLSHVERVINLYGPSEDTTYSTMAVLERGHRGPPPVGRPIANSQAYVLDAALQPVPSGVPGEVVLGGAGLARGYLGRPGLTAERFVPDPFGGEAGGRLYRTGDLARALPDGNLLFLGRVDHQVKLRGFRIELGEIEAVMGRHPAVREVALLVREDRAGQPCLVAYLVAVEGLGTRPGQEELRRYVGNTLPEYMVPQAVVWLEALPLTPNGKLDRKALPAPEASGLSGEGEHVAPRTDTERALAGVWSTVLGVEGIGVHDDFFALGGHSLLATQVVTRLREVFGMDLPLRALFEARTVGSLAVQIDARRSEEGNARHGRIESVDRSKTLPLSFAQQRLWFLAQFDSMSAVYHLPSVVQLRGALKGHALAQALDEVVSRHEALRTTFSVEEGRPVQRIQAPEPVRFHEHDVTEQPPEARDAAVKALLHALSQQPFDLGTGPLLRADLVKVDAEEHVLLLTLHHIISDGWSTGVLIGELAALYEAAVEGKRSPLPPLSIQYADFAQWQRGWLEGAVLSEQLAYWREQLGDGVAQLNLPTDRARPAVQSFRGAVHTQLLPRGLLEQVQALSQQAGTTLYMTLLATFQLLLGRYASQDDIAVGSPIANRTRPELEGLIGVFINTLVLRTRLSGNPTFRELLGRVREVTLGAYAHQDVPFERLVEELQTERELSRSPLFQVFFIVQNAPMPSLELAGLQMKALDLDTGTSKFDLTFSLVEQPEGLRLWIEYTTDLFEAATVERMGRHFEQLLGAACGQPDMSIWRLPMLGEGELRELVVERNATGRDYPLETTLPEMLKAQALRTPEARAVVFGEDALSYGELDARAEALARRLRRCGVGGEARVGVCLRRSAELVVVLVAILKAGGAYVPLDPAYPVERLGFMLEDAQAALLITQSSLRSLLPEVSMPVLELDTAAAEETAAGPLEPRSGAMLPGQLAYLIYTSGSTGRPKAVAITHRNAVAMIHWALEAFEREDLARVVAATSICFDLSVFELFVPLCCGGQVTLLDSILDLPSLPKDSGVTLVNTVPSAMNELVRSGGLPSSVRVVNLAGEALPSSLVEGLYRLSHVERVINLYGPSEDTTYSTMAVLERGHRGPPPVGRPIANSQAYVLDAALQPVPSGVPGEVVLGGAGLARGYLGRPGLTAERFVPDPFGGEAGGRLYRTGDLARALPDGNLLFLGRVDHQVKLRGFRIELGEIEAMMGRHPAVREVALLVREDRAGQPCLVAYLVAVEGLGTRPGQEELRRYVGNTLPEYMVPQAVVWLEALPLTPNGKLDRKALPAPEALGSEAFGSAEKEEHVAPRTDTERTLAAIWSAVLGVEGIGVHDDFFALGGHSLRAVHLMAEIKERLGPTLPLSSLFQRGTIAQLALLLGGMEPQRGSPLIPIRPGGSRPPLFFIHPVGGDVICYGALARHLDPEQPLYAFQSPGLYGGDLLADDIEAMAAHYVDALKADHPEGPYRLGGWSFGGTLAFAMAGQLQRQGQEVALLVLVDSFASLPTTQAVAEPTEQLAEIASSYGLHVTLEDLRLLAPDAQLGLVLEKACSAGLLPKGTETAQIHRYLNVFRNNLRAFERYRPQPYSGPITFYRAAERALGELHDPVHAWRELSLNRIDVHDLPGSHRTMVTEPHVGALVRRLMASLDRCRAG
ncbi:non-ribosomal peptide synthetase [Chondromyces crocatus]|uniref:Peptide synthetase n=1 Tax=Chondromyces crocatus TaxID=52 RepID=A0A0K1EK03_CHOCO|nr:non-ribosomal peptide synthetase [Chondromyces crocatus]AKT41191.1 peptide synthetase [Chondromyces crocatus]